MECGEEIWCRRKNAENLAKHVHSVKSCVRCPDNLTEFFECPIGVRQGCVLSPPLFSFLINELALEIAQNGMYGVQLTPHVVHAIC